MHCKKFKKLKILKKLWQPIQKNKNFVKFATFPQKNKNYGERTDRSIKK